MRTRMSGGVGGERRSLTVAPYPDGLLRGNRREHGRAGLDLHDLEVAARVIGKCRRIDAPREVSGGVRERGG